MVIIMFIIFKCYMPYLHCQAWSNWKDFMKNCVLVESLFFLKKKKGKEETCLKRFGFRETGNQVFKNWVSVISSLAQRNLDFVTISICFVANTTGGENAHMSLSLIMFFYNFFSLNFSVNTKCVGTQFLL